jgi:tetratricopeptide (TPR) repeat protein
MTLLELGRYYLRREEWEEAIPLYARAVESAPADPRVLTSYGRALRRSGDREAGADQYRRALELDPFWADARYALAEHYARIDDRESARREYQLLALNNPSYESREVRRRLQALIR